METNSERPLCRNCGEPLQGPYCHHCGQSAKVVRRHARDLVEDVLGNTLQWDSRLLLTLKLLFLRPGQLALDWIEGRRARYVPPFRLYIVASFIMFLLFGLLGKEKLVQTDSVQVTPNSTEEIRQSLQEAREEGDWLSEILLQGTLQALDDPAGFRKRVRSRLPNAAFLLLPAFAALHMLVNIRRERYYIDHLVFSLHFHAFAFLLLSVIIIAGAISAILGEIAAFLNLLIPVYLAIGFHTFNQQGWGKSILKAALVFGAYLILLTVGVAFYVLLSRI